MGFPLPAARLGGVALLSAALLAPTFTALPSVDAQERGGRALASPQNPFPIDIPGGGDADPYPSTLEVAGVPGRIRSLSLRLFGVSHTRTDDLDIMLVSPTGQAVVILSDAGGATNTDDLELTFRSRSSIPAPDETPLEPNLYRATNYDGGDDDAFGPTAPTRNAASMRAFHGESANGKWRLFVRDDTANDFDGQISGGWQLRIVTTNSPPEANNDQYATPKNQRRFIRASDGVLANDSDPDGSVDYIEVIPFKKESAKGTIRVTKRGTVVYTPKRGRVGRDFFEYTIRDLQGKTDTAIIVINIDE